MELTDFTAQLRADRERIDARLDELLPQSDEPPESLHRAMRYTTLGGGKRLRGILCIASHRLFGDPYPGDALDAACAVEILHTYTLIHDDLPVIDNDDMRRGQPSCHVQFGEAAAILCGDALHALAFNILTKCQAPESAVLEAIKILSRTAGSLFLVGGQVADIEGEGKEPTRERVTFIHSRKTAELIAASMAIGAVLAEVPRNNLDALYRIGRDVGFAFQVVDDLLDLEGSEELVGKGLRKDSEKGKITYPSCCGVSNAREVARRLITDSISRIQRLGDQGYLQRLFAHIGDRVS